MSSDMSIRQEAKSNVYGRKNKKQQNKIEVQMKYNNRERSQKIATRKLKYWNLNRQATCIQWYGKDTFKETFIYWLQWNRAIYCGHSLCYRNIANEVNSGINYVDGIVSNGERKLWIVGFNMKTRKTWKLDNCLIKKTISDNLEILVNKTISNSLMLIILLVILLHNTKNICLIQESLCCNIFRRNENTS